MRVLLVLALACLAGLTFGETRIALADLWHGLLGDGPAAFTLSVLRGPRAAVAVLAGAALGLSGAVFQSLLRNPLASPDVMGFTSGAGLGAVAVVTLAGSGAVAVSLGAAAGGLVAALLVGLLAYGPGGLVPLRLILVGIGAGFSLSAGSEFLMTRLNGPDATEAMRWMTGSLAARNWGHAVQTALALAVLALPLALGLRWLALLELGDDLAAGLGLRVTAARVGLALLGVALAVVAVAVAGPVPFVALMAAPLARRISGASGGPALLAAAGIGAALMVLADLAARGAVPGVQLPLGVMTGILGAPYLLWVLSREMDRGRL